MLVANQLSKSYGHKTVLQDVSLTVNDGDRIGLVGPNGCGKTTLLRLLAGEEKPGAGHVVLEPPALRIGYLAQGFASETHLTLRQLIHQTVGDPKLMEREIRQLASSLAAQPDNIKLQTAYDAVLTKLSQHEEGLVQTTLASLNLQQLDESTEVGTLSGGQKTRLSLAMVMVSRPELLLLDEPTNHLDIQVLQWLESWLAEYAGAAVIVSHDRTFLDRTVNQILELDPETHKTRRFVGNYSQYIELILKEQEKQLAAYRDQLYEIRRMKQDIQRTMEQARWVERTTIPRQPGVRRYAKKVARKAKSREKKLERYLESEDRVEKPARSWQMKLELDTPTHLGADALRLEELAVGYPGHEPLLQGLNHYVGAGQRIALTGPNGAGKSTLLRTIAGHLEPLAGSVRLGASVQLGYMAQEQELLEPELTPLSTIQRVSDMNQTDARSFLHYFLFSGDDALRVNRLLSYGERSRLSLATLVAQGCNFLLLDEPINHLDIPSRERFEQALTGFEGTVLAVVHDRYFVARFATELWVTEERRIRSEILR